MQESRLSSNTNKHLQVQIWSSILHKVETIFEDICFIDFWNIQASVIKKEKWKFYVPHSKK